MRKIFWLTNILFSIFYVNTLYFHLYKDEKRCFYDEYYSDTVKNKKMFLNNNIIQVLLIRFDVLDKNSLYLQTKNEKRIQIGLLYNNESEEETKVETVEKFESEKLKGKFSKLIEKSIFFNNSFS